MKITFLTFYVKNPGTFWNDVFVIVIIVVIITI